MWGVWRGWDGFPSFTRFSVMKSPLRLFSVMHFSYFQLSSYQLQKEKKCHKKSVKLKLNSSRKANLLFTSTTSILVVFWLSSIWVVFYLGCLPYWFSSFLVIFHFGNFHFGCCPFCHQRKMQIYLKMFKNFLDFFQKQHRCSKCGPTKEKLIVPRNMTSHFISSEVCNYLYFLT